MLGAHRLELGPHSLKRREIQDLAAAEIDPVNSPVLVTVLVLQVEDMIAGVGPEIAAYAAIGVIGNRFGLLRRICRPHPDVENAVLGARKLILEPSGLMRVVIRSGLPKSRSLEISALLVYSFRLLLAVFFSAPPRYIAE